MKDIEVRRLIQEVRKLHRERKKVIPLKVPRVYYVNLIEGGRFRSIMLGVAFYHGEAEEFRKSYRFEHRRCNESALLMSEPCIPWV
jgi:hypothetical protein